MIEVEIQNFQSIEKVAFSIKGFTALVGRSNIGKSAVVRALQCALTAAAGTDFVRHGKACERRVKGRKKCRCQTTVILTLGGRTLKWEKGDGVNQYTVTREGKEPVLYTALGSGTPEFLSPDFDLVKVGSKNELIQIGEQFNPIFLLNQSGPATADVLSDVARLDDLNEAIRLVNKDNKSNKSTRKVREKDVVSLKERLEVYEGLDDALTKAKQVDTTYDIIAETQERAAKLDGWFGSHVALTGSVTALEAATEPPEPDVDGLGVVADKAFNLVGFYDSVKSLAPAIRRLLGIDEVELPDFSLPEAQKRVAKLEGWIGGHAVLTASVEALEAATASPELDFAEIDAVSERMERFDGWFQGLPRTKKEYLKLKGILEVKDLDLVDVVQQEVQVAVLDRWIIRLAKLQKREVELATQLKVVEQGEQTILDEFKQLGVCPTCEQGVEVDGHLHGEVA